MAAGSDRRKTVWKNRIRKSGCDRRQPQRPSPRLSRTAAAVALRKEGFRSKEIAEKLVPINIVYRLLTTIRKYATKDYYRAIPWRLFGKR